MSINWKLEEIFLSKPYSLHLLLFQSFRHFFSLHLNIDQLLYLFTEFFFIYFFCFIFWNKKQDKNYFSTFIIHFFVFVSRVFFSHHFSYEENSCVKQFVIFNFFSSSSSWKVCVYMFVLNRVQVRWWLFLEILWNCLLQL